MLRLMNSAMMPCDGNYSKKTITPQEARQIFRKNRDNYKSYIGYPQTAQILSTMFGEQIEVSREETVLEDGDVLLVSRLKYRVNPAEKAGNTHGQKLEDYEFSEITYKKE